MPRVFREMEDLLRSQAAEITQYGADYCEEQEKDFRAEIARLRAALEEIAVRDGNDYFLGPPDEEAYRSICAIARKALEGEK